MRARLEHGAAEVWQLLQQAGFPLFGLTWWEIAAGLLIIFSLSVSYSIAGKGQGSHAGREEIRRAYRRKLAQEMAKQDADKIKVGEKPRRRWMQW